MSPILKSYQIKRNTPSMGELLGGESGWVKFSSEYTTIINCLFSHRLLPAFYLFSKAFEENATIFFKINTEYSVIIYTWIWNIYCATDTQISKQGQQGNRYVATKVAFRHTAINDNSSRTLGLQFPRPGCTHTPSMSTHRVTKSPSIRALPCHGMLQWRWLKIGRKQRHLWVALS